jgi:hypothetical protein
MERQAAVLREVVERERRLQRELVSRVFAPADARRAASSPGGRVPGKGAAAAEPASGLEDLFQTLAEDSPSALVLVHERGAQSVEVGGLVDELGGREQVPGGAARAPEIGP